MATSSGNVPPLPPQDPENSQDPISLSEPTEPDSYPLDTLSLSVESDRATSTTGGNWQVTSFKKENERLRQQVVKLRKALDSERDQLKHMKKDAQETLVRVRREERDTARHKHNELQLKLERQNQGQLKNSESHWQTELVRLQGDIRQLRQETSKLKIQQQNLETAKRRAEEELRKRSQEHESEIELIRRSGGQDLRKQHDETRTRDKELREKKRDLDHVNERALRLESKVDELEGELGRLKGGLSLERASPRALLTSRDASLGDRSFHDVTTPVRQKLVSEGATASEQGEPGSDRERERQVIDKNVELSSLAHRLDERVKRLVEEKQELLNKLKREQASSDPLKDETRKLSTIYSELSSSQRRMEDREKRALGEAKKLKLTQTGLENQLSSLRQELSTEKSRNLRVKMNRQQLERVQIELKRSQGELTGQKETILSLEKEREDLKKRIDLLKHSKKQLSEERDSALKQSQQRKSEQNNASEKEWENASQASFLQSELDQVVFERDELKASMAQLYSEHLTLQRASTLLSELSEEKERKGVVDSDAELEREEELSRIEAELRESKARVTELEAVISEREEEVRSRDLLQEQIDTLTHSLQSTDIELGEAQGRVRALEEELSGRVVAESRTEGDTHQLELTIEKLKQEMLDESVTHEEELSRARADKSRMEEELRDKINRIGELDSELFHAIASNKLLQERLEELTAQQTDSESLLEGKQMETEAYLSDIEKLTRDVESAQEQLMQFSDGKNELLREVEELRKLLSEKNSEIESGSERTLTEKLELVNSELSAAESERDDLRTKLVCAEGKLVGEQQLQKDLGETQELYKRASEENSLLHLKADQLGAIERQLELNREELERLREREGVLETQIQELKMESKNSQLELFRFRETSDQKIEKIIEEKNSLEEAYTLQLREAQMEIDSLRLSDPVMKEPATDTQAGVPESPLRSRISSLEQQLVEAQGERDSQEGEREAMLLAKQAELDEIQGNLRETEGKLAGALQTALQLSQGEEEVPESPLSSCEGGVKGELKVHIEAALLNIREGAPEAAERHLRIIQSLIEDMSTLPRQEAAAVTSDEFSLNNIMVEIDGEKEAMRQELAEFQEAFSALEEELEETRSALQSFQNQERELRQQNRVIQNLRVQVSDLQLIISSETQRPQRDKSSLPDEEPSITTSLLDSPQSRFLEPRLFVTLFDYDPMSLCTTGHPERQLPLKAGDIVVVHGDMDATAHYQSTHGGTAGLVPANFIEELIISDPLARQRLLNQSLTPDRREVRVEEAPDETCSSSDEEDSQILTNTGVKKVRGPPLPPSNLCVERILQDNILLSWDPPKLSASGKSNRAYVLGYRFIVNNEPKKDVIGALQGKCLLEGLTPGVPLSIQLLTLSDNDIASQPCTIQHPPISSSHSRPSTASSHFSLPISLADTTSPATSSSTLLEPSHTVVALYEYNSAVDSPNEHHEFELSFKESDVITVYGLVMEDGFFFGELNGKKGLVPSNFVRESDELNTLPKNRSISASDSQSITVSTPETPAPISTKQVLALYSYNPQNMSPNDNPEIELSFKEGDVIQVDSEVDKYGFYHGEVGGIQGLIPSNFVTELDPISSGAETDQASGVSPTPTEELSDETSYRREKMRKGVFQKGKKFVKKLGLIGSPRNPKT